MQHPFTWDLLTNYETTFSGGEATFHYRLDPAGPVVPYPIKIRGTNPDDATVISYIQSQDPFTYLPAMARKESFVPEAGSTYQFNQFNPAIFGDDTLDNLPNWGGPDGWGIMQLDGSKEGVFITIEQLWNWKTNVQGGVAVLETKRLEMIEYVDAVQAAFPLEFEDPYSPGAYEHDVTVESTTYTLLFEEASKVQRYNGGSEVVVGTITYAAAWRFLPNASAGERWAFVANQNNYVQEVLEEFHVLSGN